MTDSATSKFDLSIFEEAPHKGVFYDGPVLMNGITVLGRQIQVGPRYVHFAVTGKHYRYSVSVWPSLVQIVAYQEANGRSERRGELCAQNQDELLKAIKTIAADHKSILAVAPAAV